MTHASDCPDIDTPRPRPTRRIYSPIPTRADVEKPACAELSSPKTTDLETNTPAEAARYGELCGIVQSNLSGFGAMTAALAEIRHSMLYRYEFDTWAQFCRKKFDLSKTHANRLIEAGDIKMTPIGVKITNEAQARAIAKVPEADREQVLGMAGAVGPVTAASIESAHATLKFCMPHTVCPSCGGVRPEECTHCSGAGLLSELLWKITPPEELKAFRAKNLLK